MEPIAHRLGWSMARLTGHCLRGLSRIILHQRLHGQLGVRQALLI